ncbi:AI-2E family transporter [Patescibacteria group bacterium]|nr:AI-2E family transporter [Patescibacteria group bacterium]
MDRAILTPFVLAAIFAYIFNPVVNFFSNRIKLPRTLSVLIIYLFLMAIVVLISVFITKRIVDESVELKGYVATLAKTTKTQINALPDYARPFAQEGAVALEKSRIFAPASVFSLFPQAISRIISFFIFLFASFYFLKEGSTLMNKFLNYMPNKNRVDIEIVLRKMNKVFGGYLRGQLFLVVLVSLILYIALAILGVKFALVIAVFSGFAEIVPIIGPITAGAVASLVVLLTGISNFPLTPIQGAAVVVAIYFIARQLEDYFVIPQVMGRITELHPLIILFAVISGGHIWGAIGLILAVPIAGAIKILLDFSLDKINESDKKKVLGRE